MRPSTACVACRQRRRRCETASSGQACLHCQDRDVTCSFTAKANASNGIWSSPPISPTTTEFELTRCQSISTQLPARPLCVELVDLYFRYIHDTFHSIFHRPSLMEEVEAGTVPKVLLFGIISLSARFSDDLFFAGSDPRARGRPYAREAEHLLDLREVSLTTVQACVLIGAFTITEGEAASEAVYYGIACRNALLLDLPNMPTASRVDQEINRRCFWTLNMIDVWSSNGVRLPRSMSPRSDVAYPMQETVFLELRRSDFDMPSPTSLRESSASLLTQMIELNAILVEIQTLNQLAASQPFYDPTLLNPTVDTLTSKLESWYTSLPPRLQDTHANLTHWAALGLGPMFVAVYLGYYHYGQLLYYQYLHEDCFEASSPSVQSRVRHYADKCKTHSTALLEITYRAYSVPGCEVYYTMVGHVLVIASTVQLHILLFGTDEIQIRAARSRLERNFEILSKLQSYWPTLDVCFSRFREFHKACERSKEGSFRLDRWMGKFLFEFAKPMEEKEEGVDGLGELRPWTMEDLGFSPY